MELDENLVKLQGTLYSLGMQGFLNNPDATQKVVKDIKEAIENIPNEEKAKLAYFMVLRTGFSTFDNLQDDESIGHFIYTEPDFEKEFLVTYIYHLNLQSELFRIVEHCPAALGVELSEVVLKKLKDPLFHKDQFGCEHLFQLWKSIFVKLCKTDGGLSEESAMEFPKLFTKVSHLIRDILVMLVKVKQLELLGVSLYYFFKSIWFFVTLQKSPDLSDDPLYKFGSECSWVTTSSSLMVSAVNEVISQIPVIWNQLTVDIWMSFSEFYLDPNSKNSIQLQIGDFVYKIFQELKNGELYEVPSDVLSMLSSIAINKRDIIAKSDIDDIISNVENGDLDSFTVLIGHTDFAKDEIVKCLLDNLQLASLGDLDVILNTSYSHICNNTEIDDCMRKLFLSALKKSENHAVWMEKVFKNYQPTLLTTATTHEELIETFNKISKDNQISDSDSVSLCMQSPMETVKKICQISICGSGQTETTIRILNLLKPACRMSVSDTFTLLDHIILKSLLDELTDKDKAAFINLIVQLGKENLLGNSFFKNLLRTLKENLESGATDKAVYSLEVLRAILDLKIFHVEKSPFLVFMSQILAHFSWDLETFSMIKAAGRDVVCNIINSTISGLDERDDFNHEWVQHEIGKLHTINQACFCDVWFKFNSGWSGSGTFHNCILALAYTEEKSDDIRKFLIDLDEPLRLRASVLTSLAVLLPVLTFREWNLIFNKLLTVWKNLNSDDVQYEILHLYGSALEMFVRSKRKETYPCCEYCLRNYAKLLKQTCTKLKENFLSCALEKILALVGAVEEEAIRKSVWEIFSPVLMTLVEMMKKKNCTEAEKTKIGTLVQVLVSKEIADAMLKALQ